MGYGFDLVRLPAGVDRAEAYEKTASEREEWLSAGGRELAPIDPSKEAIKRRLAAELLARYPTLNRFRYDYSALAKSKSITEAEARQRFRVVELNERRLGFQITLFDDAAGATYHGVHGGGHAECVKALRVLWGCFEILESKGGFSIFDCQIAKVLDLSTDFEVVRRCCCGL